jgi:hypothetical protein
MKRDCGTGELIPVRFEVVSCKGTNDKEKESRHATLVEALAEYNHRTAMLHDIKCSDVRLYAKDKQGYANCIKSWMLDASGVVHERDRLEELK